MDTEPDWGTVDIQLHIEELVLHQFARGDRHAIADALQVELTRLLRVEGVPQGLTTRVSGARINGGDFQVPPDATPGIIGTQLARTLYQNLGRYQPAAGAPRVQPSQGASRP